MVDVDARRDDTTRWHRLAGNITGWHGLLALLAVGAAGAVLLRYPRAFLGVDFDVYRGAGATVLDGAPLYGFTSPLKLPFTYPPIAAVLFSPLAVLPAAIAAAVWTLISVLAMEAVIWSLLRPLGVTDPAARVRWTAVASLATLPLAPVTFNLWIGQVNLILLLLVIADLVGARGRFRGVGVGIAAGIKLTPLIFLPYLLFTRGRRAAGTAALTFAATILACFVLLPRDSVEYWFTELWDFKRVTQIPDDKVARTLNASIRGVLDQLEVPHAGAIWLVLAALVGVAGLAVAVRASRRGHDLAGILAGAITGLLISPVSWIFHWVWCVPLLVIWAVRAWRGHLPAEKAGVVLVWLAFLASSCWIVLQTLRVPHPGELATLFGNYLYVLIGLLTLGALAAGTGRDRPAGARTTRPD
ncbi:glycosyltransferase 87 family protein [Amycolatopsis sp. NBC_01488]|uniref:glycosyltransferase 87 family protein n=1 Tax=Amycolatopsis sp. NBC_01488 TaxID=2903563 RepID=UPI002E2DC582|nr:glycosyltransferase 87 family protein [Amycolatopsis sp. NBC_01488]